MLCGLGIATLVGCAKLQQPEAPNDSISRNLNEMKARPKAPIVGSDNRDARIAELERQLADRDAELAKLRKGSGDLSSANRRIGELESQLGDRDRELTRLRSGLGDMESANKRIGDLERHLADRDSELNRLRPIVAAHEREGNVSGDLDSLKKQLADRDAEIARLRAIEKEHDAEHPEFARLKAIEKEHDAEHPELARLKNGIDERDQEIARLKDLLGAQPKTEMAKAEKDLVKALGPEIKAGNVSISQSGDRLAINLAATALFDSGQAELKPAGTDILTRVGGVLKEFPDKTIHVAGHTDNVPIRSALKKKYPTNKELSDARAQHAAEILEKSGVNKAKLSAAGHADGQPVGDNKTEAGRKKNRRVEVIVSN
jgi:chemotaxis protein MotB